RLEPGDHAQERRLAAARRPDDHHEFAVGNCGADAVDHLGVAVALAHVVERDLGHYFSVSTRPRTNHFCISSTTSAGGSIASIAVAMISGHSLAASAPTIMRLMPITVVYIDSSLVTSSGHRYWLQPQMNWLTNSAAMLGLDSGSRAWRKRRGR